MVPLVECANEMEARLLAQRLAAEGISSMVKALGSGYALGVNQFISHRVEVPQEHLARAREVAGLGDPAEG